MKGVHSELAKSKDLIYTSPSNVEVTKHLPDGGCN